MNRIGLTDTICGAIGSNCLADQEWEAKPVFRIGLNYQPATYTFVRASFGQGYRFPTIAEKFVETTLGDQALIIGGNENLQSETGWSAEVGVKQGIKISDWKGYVDGALFWTEYQDMMEFTFGQLPTGAGFSSINTGDTRIAGGEITLVGKGKIGPLNAELLAGYTKIDPIYLNFDSLTERSSSVDYNILKYRFTDSFKGDVQFTYNRIGLGFSGKYNSYMEAIDEAFETGFAILELREARSENPYGEWVFDTRVSWKFNDKHSIAFLVGNVFNNEYTVRPAMYESPRNFTVKYSFEM